MMKRTARVFGLLVLAMAIGLSMAACGDGGDGPGPGPGPSGPPSSGGALGGGDGESVTISNQQVYLDNGDYEEFTGYWFSSYTPYTGNLTLHDYNDLYDGSIATGKLTYNLKTPDDIDLHSVEGIELMFSGFYDHGEEFLGFKNITVVHSDGKGTGTYGFNVDSDLNYYAVYRENITGNITGNSFSYTSKDVRYIYVDSDVTITGKGGSAKHTFEGISITFTLADLNILLKKGWNAICMSESDSASISNGMPTSGSVSASYTSADPTDCKWVLYGDYMHHHSIRSSQKSIGDAPEAEAFPFQKFQQRWNRLLFPAK